MKLASAQPTRTFPRHLLHCWASLRSAPTCKSIPAQKSPAPTRRASYRNSDQSVVMTTMSAIMPTAVTAIVVPSAMATVVVVPAPMRIAAPVCAAIIPAAVVVHPARAVVDVARARAMPDAADPHVTAAVPVPVTRRPHVSGARRRHHFIARRWRRRSDAQAETDLRGCRRRERRGRAHCDRERGKQCKVACLHETPPS